MIYIRIAEVLNIKGGHFREAVVEKRQNSMREKNRNDAFLRPFILAFARKI